MGSDANGHEAAAGKATRADPLTERRTQAHAGGDRGELASTGTFREYVERSPVATAVVDGERLTLRYTNPAFWQLTGATDIFADRAPADAVPSRRAERVAALLRQVSESGKAENDVAIELSESDEEEATSWRVTVWPIGHSRRLPPPPDLILQIRDTAEERRERHHQVELGKQLRDINERLLLASLREEELRDEAQAANVAKSVFLATMSHELRTPLAAIIGYEELLADAITGPINAEQREQLARIKRSAAHLLALVDEVLTLSRVEANHEVACHESVDLGELVGQITTIVAPLATAKRIPLRTEIPDHPITLTTDPLKVRQILVNLLGNAVKFSNGKPVDFTVRDEGRTVVFAVRDEGIGIAPEHMERIFDAFWQVRQRSDRPIGGSGLGLSVSRSLAQLLGGEVTVESALGTGSTFALRIPRGTPASAEKPVAHV